MKLDPNLEDYHQSWGWVAHPDRRHEKSLDDAEKVIVENRYKLEIIGGVSDNEADYSYNDWALCKLKNKYYLLSTSGCSCPSPKETWYIEIGPTTLKQIEKHIKSGAYEGYTLPKKQEADFLALIEEAKALNDK
jgi:hypothetical protein